MIDPVNHTTGAVESRRTLTRNVASSRGFASARLISMLRLTSTDPFYAQCLNLRNDVITSRIRKCYVPMLSCDDAWQIARQRSKGNRDGLFVVLRRISRNTRTRIILTGGAESRTGGELRNIDDFYSENLPGMTVNAFPNDAERSPATIPSPTSTIIIMGVAVGARIAAAQITRWLSG